MPQPPRKQRTRLHAMQINRVDLVDRGAAQHADILIVKRDELAELFEKGAAVTCHSCADIDAVAQLVATSSTDAQREAGNYRKGHIILHGLHIAIENARGSTRTKISRGTGKPWSVVMPAHYGYIKRTVGADGDHVDAYIGPNPEAADAHVVDQHHAHDGSFDEHKVMLGFPSRDAALAAYDAAFSDGSGPARRKAVTTLPLEGFKAWLSAGDTTKPIAGQVAVETVADTAVEQPRADVIAPLSLGVTTVAKLDLGLNAVAKLDLGFAKDDFDETKHPRDHGKFSHSQGAGGGGHEVTVRVGPSKQPGAGGAKGKPASADDGVEGATKIREAVRRAMIGALGASAGTVLGALWGATGIDAVADAYQRPGSTAWNVIAALNPGALLQNIGRGAAAGARAGYAIGAGLGDSYSNLLRRNQGLSEIAKADDVDDQGDGAAAGGDAAPSKIDPKKAEAAALAVKDVGEDGSDERLRAFDEKLKATDPAYAKNREMVDKHQVDAEMAGQVPVIRESMKKILGRLSGTMAFQIEAALNLPDSPAAQALEATGAEIDLEAVDLGNVARALHAVSAVSTVGSQLRTKAFDAKLQQLDAGYKANRKLVNEQADECARLAAGDDDDGADTIGKGWLWEPEKHPRDADGRFTGGSSAQEGAAEYAGRRVGQAAGAVVGAVAGAKLGARLGRKGARAYYRGRPGSGTAGYVVGGVTGFGAGADVGRELGGRVGAAIGRGVGRLAPRRVEKAFDETAHPRAADGKFTSSGGGVAIGIRSKPQFDLNHPTPGVLVQRFPDGSSRYPAGDAAVYAALRRGEFTPEQVQAHFRALGRGGENTGRGVGRKVGAVAGAVAGAVVSGKAGAFVGRGIGRVVGHGVGGVVGMVEGARRGRQRTLDQGLTRATREGAIAGAAAGSIVGQRIGARVGGAALGTASALFPGALVGANVGANIGESVGGTVGAGIDRLRGRTIHPDLLATLRGQRVAKVFDPNQPRDDHGQWVDADGNPNNGGRAGRRQPDRGARGILGRGVRDLKVEAKRVLGAATTGAARAAVAAVKNAYQSATSVRVKRVQPVEGGGLLFTVTARDPTSSKGGHIEARYQVMPGELKDVHGPVPAAGRAGHSDGLGQVREGAAVKNTSVAFAHHALKVMGIPEVPMQSKPLEVRVSRFAADSTPFSGDAKPTQPPASDQNQRRPDQGLSQSQREQRAALSNQDRNKVRDLTDSPTAASMVGQYTSNLSTRYRAGDRSSNTLDWRTSYVIEGSKDWGKDASLGIPRGFVPAGPREWQAAVQAGLLGDFDTSKHPRDDRGRFISSGGAPSGAAPAASSPKPASVGAPVGAAAQQPRAPADQFVGARNYNGVDLPVASQTERAEHKRYVDQQLKAGVPAAQIKVTRETRAASAQPAAPAARRSSAIEELHETATDQVHSEAHEYAVEQMGGEITNLERYQQLHEKFARKKILSLTEGSTKLDPEILTDLVDAERKREVSALTAEARVMRTHIGKSVWDDSKHPRGPGGLFASVGGALVAHPQLSRIKSKARALAAQIVGQARPLPGEGIKRFARRMVAQHGPAVIAAAVELADKGNANVGQHVEAMVPHVVAYLRGIAGKVMKADLPPGVTVALDALLETAVAKYEERPLTGPFEKFDPAQARDALGRWAGGAQEAGWSARRAITGRGERIGQKEVRRRLLAHDAEHGTERGISMSRGRVQFDVVGTRNSVTTMSRLDRLLGRRLDERGIASHNHPGGSAPSTQDFVHSAFHGNQRNAVYSEGGGIFRYRGRLKRNDSVDHMLAFKAAVDLAGSIAEREAIKRLRAGSTGRARLERLSRASIHATALGLKDAGLIEYRFRLGPADQRAVSKHPKMVAGIRAKVADATRHIAGLIAKYDPDQPRARDGKWTDGGAGAAAGAPRTAATEEEPAARVAARALGETLGNAGGWILGASAAGALTVATKYPAIGTSLPFLTSAAGGALGGHLAVMLHDVLTRYRPQSGEARGDFIDRVTQELVTGGVAKAAHKRKLVLTPAQRALVRAAAGRAYDHYAAKAA